MRRSLNSLFFNQFPGCYLLISSSPKNEHALLNRAQNLAGLSFAEVAAQLKANVPPNLQRNKGWVGTLIESALGATAGSKAEQDFAHLGIELKTIPVNSHGFPLETTFVCVAPLTGNTGITWATSHVRRKLSRVLWVPVEGERHIELAHRRIGTAFIWSPSWQQEQQLKADWEELMDLIVLGKIAQINAKHGQYLQLRPKASNSRELTEAVGKQGEPILTLPRGFYLKKTFTGPLLANYFAG